MQVCLNAEHIAICHLTAVDVSYYLPLSQPVTNMAFLIYINLGKFAKLHTSKSGYH